MWNTQMTKLELKDIVKEPEQYSKAMLIFWATIILILSVLVSNLYSAEPFKAMKMIRPFDDNVYPVVITGKFGASRTHAEGGHEYPHTGLDYKLEKNTNLRASYDGVVIFAEDSEAGYGNLVKIDHGYGVQTWYAHLSRPDVVEGQIVKQGQLIGKVGRSGRAFGYHAHWETRVNGKPVHPAQFIF